MINILYEDNHIIVVEKPVNIPVCEDSSRDLDLLTIIKNYLKEKYNKPGNVYLGLIHRLDRPVGGVIVFAKTSKAASRLSESLRKGLFKKKYYAVLCGSLLNSGKLEDYLLKDSKTNMVKVDKTGKYACLNYKVLDVKNNMTLVDISLQTGRSHQIRVQFASRGYPLFGDQKYNKKAIVGEQIALYSYQLTFPHPITKEDICFSLPLPKVTPFSNFNQEQHLKSSL